MSSSSRLRSKIRSPGPTTTAPLDAVGFVGLPLRGGPLRMRARLAAPTFAAFRRSLRRVGSSRRLYRIAAGWYVGRTGMSPKASVFPRASFSSTPVPSKPFNAVDPSVTKTLGRTAAICVIRYGRQVSISSERGPRFAGGRHFTTFVMNTERRGSRAAASALSRIFPADPTNGSPRASSSRPGASPIRNTAASSGPTPGTARFRPS